MDEKSKETDEGRDKYTGQQNESESGKVAAEEFVVEDLSSKDIGQSSEHKELYPESFKEDKHVTTCFGKLIEISENPYLGIFLNKSKSDSEVEDILEAYTEEIIFSTDDNPMIEPSDEQEKMQELLKEAFIQESPTDMTASDNNPSEEVESESDLPYSCQSLLDDLKGYIKEFKNIERKIQSRIKECEFILASEDKKYLKMNVKNLITLFQHLTAKEGVTIPWSEIMSKINMEFVEAYFQNYLELRIEDVEITIDLRSDLESKLSKLEAYMLKYDLSAKVQELMNISDESHDLKALNIRYRAVAGAFQIYFTRLYRLMRIFLDAVERYGCQEKKICYALYVFFRRELPNLFNP